MQIEQSRQEAVPWYVHALMLLGSIFGMGLFIAFLAVADVLDSKSFAGGLGFLFMLAAIALRYLAFKLKNHTFQMLLLTGFITGQVLFFFSIESAAYEKTIFFFIALAQLLFFAIYFDDFYRFLALPLAFTFYYASLTKEGSLEANAFVLIILNAIVCLLILLWSGHAFKYVLLRSAFYGCLLFLLLFSAYHSTRPGSFWYLILHYVFLFFAAILFYYKIFWQSAFPARSIWLFFALLLVLMALAWSTPAVSVSLLLASAAYMTADARPAQHTVTILILCGLGFLFYLFQYYYNMEITLLAKSLVLMASGLIFMCYSLFAFLFQKGLRENTA